MGTTRPNNAAVIDKCTQRLAALKAHVQPNDVISIEGVTHTVADVIAMYQACLDTRSALVTKRSEVQVALDARTHAEDVRRVAERALKPWVVHKFGTGSKAALDFGFPPPKVPVRSPAEKAKAVEAALATREARHTMGKKQKEKIKGTPPAHATASPPANGGVNGAGT